MQAQCQRVLTVLDKSAGRLADRKKKPACLCDSVPQQRGAAWYKLVAYWLLPSRHVFSVELGNVNLVGPSTVCLAGHSCKVLCRCPVETPDKKAYKSLQLPDSNVISSVGRTAVVELAETPCEFQAIRASLVCAPKPWKLKITNMRTSQRLRHRTPSGWKPRGPSPK